MAEPLTYQRITLKFSSPFPKKSDGVQEWQVKFSLSGANLSSQADAEATALDLFKPIQRLTSPNTSLIGWVHYPTGSAINDFQESYAIGAHPGNYGGYTDVAHSNNCQLEVIALAKCRVGTNSKGRAAYLFKHIHDVLCVASGGQLAVRESDATIMAEWDTGAGPHALVPVAPRNGTQGGPWVLDEALYTRQLRRGQKKTAP